MITNTLCFLLSHHHDPRPSFRKHQSTGLRGVALASDYNYDHYDAIDPVSNLPDYSNTPCTHSMECAGFPESKSKCRCVRSDKETGTCHRRMCLPRLGSRINTMCAENFTCESRNCDTLSGRCKECTCASGRCETFSGRCTCAENRQCASNNCDTSGLCKDERRVCTRDYSPVCGEDGVTYSNSCWASPVKVAYLGDCIDYPTAAPNTPAAAPKTGWPDGTLCFQGISCNNCENEATWWYGTSSTNCGNEPKYPDGTYCFAGTSCNNCLNSYKWYPSGFYCGK